ncbi:MAG: zinc metalloprotease HtpX [Dehalococcoidia bacterium]|nr:zinc metalloprotease HtpX [Dehalococcoidia bacterium]
MFWLRIRMYLLVVLLFAILYGVFIGIGTALGAGGMGFYIGLAFFMTLLQYMIGPALVAWSMKVKWVSESEAPELHRMVAELAQQANLPKPKVGISEINLPNAFAFGRTQKDGRICVTRGILNLLNKDELRAVLGHEMSHIKHRDMAVMTILSVVPMILYWIAWNFLFRGMFGDRRNGGYTLVIGLGALVMYFVSNLLVLYGSRIREYYADEGSVQLGNRPHHLATALYKLAYGNAKFKGKQELKQAEGVKAFFVNDPSRAWNEVNELAQIDFDKNGTIDPSELMTLRSMKVKISTGDKIMEAMSTHPNMLKRVQHLSTLA